MKTLWSHDFHDAYEKSLKVKFKFSRYDTPAERKTVDVKGTLLARQAGFLFKWLVKGGYVKAGKYKVRFTCTICEETINAKEWGGATLDLKGVHGNLVCSRCAVLVERIRKTGEARKSKRLKLLLKKHLVSLTKRDKKKASEPKRKHEFRYRFN